MRLSPQFARDKTRAVDWWRGTRSLGAYAEPTAAAAAVLAAAVPLARLVVPPGVEAEEVLGCA